MNEVELKYFSQIEYDELMNGMNNNPHGLLGPKLTEEGQIVNAFIPNAKSVAVVDLSVKTRKKYVMEKFDDSDFFHVLIKTKKMKKYLLEIEYLDGTVFDRHDPFSFEPQFSDWDIHFFGEGKHEDIYEKMGAHLMTIDGVEGVYFAVWAPNARRVSVVGDFNMWDGRLHPMRILGRSGIYELFIPGVKEGDIYKFQILTQKGDILYKADPYANASQLRPETASVVADLTDFKWTDKTFLGKKKATDVQNKPMSIYECHLGSWKKKDDGTEDGFYNYREMAHELAGYVNEMGYTHIELLGIAEHPYDGSWGYQVTGYYAPTSRFGTPKDFMYFVNYMHKHNIQVILDWVPAHFPKDAHGLARFDGMALYEHEDERKGEHKEWGTLIFNYGREQVKNFLVANAIYWIKMFHIDGLRVDAVASMLYLDYNRPNGGWIPNKYGGKENIEAVEFFQFLNQTIREKYPTAVIIAEESTSWAKVTDYVENGGLGFQAKWNMGWMNDFLEYQKLDPYFKKDNHGKMTFSLMYAYSENFIMVLSHDEVVHGKCSMIDKMPGLYDDKFANLKAAYGFMWGHPGKKLLFMGQEFAQFREWSEDRQLDWELFEYSSHMGMKLFVQDLNKLYTSYPAMYKYDTQPRGFEWINCQDAANSVFTFMRKADEKEENLIFIFNFTPMERTSYKIGVSDEGKYSVILNSDDKKYNGLERFENREYMSSQDECDGRVNSVLVDIPPLSVIALKYQGAGKPKTIKPTVKELKAMNAMESDKTAAVKSQSEEVKVEPKAATRTAAAKTEPKAAVLAEVKNEPKTATKPAVVKTEPKVATKPAAVKSEVKAAAKPTAVKTEPKVAVKPTAVKTEPKVAVKPTAAMTEPKVTEKAEVKATEKPTAEKNNPAPAVEEIKVVEAKTSQPVKSNSRRKNRKK